LCGSPEERLLQSELNSPTFAKLIVTGLALIMLVWLWLAGLDSGNGVLGFPLDDAWIHMVYGRGLALDGVFTYNRGVPATGATSLLWASVLGILHLVLGASSVQPIIIATYVINALLLMVVVWKSMSLAQSMGAQAHTAFVAGVAVVSSSLFIVSTYSGMEVVLCAALLVAGTDAFLRQRWGLSGLLLGLACTARPEATLCLIAASVFLFSYLEKRRRAGEIQYRQQYQILFGFGLAPLLLGGSIIAYNLWASGYPLPATFYFKQSFTSGEFYYRLWLIVGEMLGSVASFAYGVVWIGLLGYVLSIPSRTKRQPGSAARLGPIPAFPLVAGLLLLLANVLTIFPSDPAAYYFQRYILPAVPLLLVALVVGLERISFGQSVWMRRLPLNLFAVFCVISGVFSVTPVSNRYHSDTRNINELQRSLGAWLRDNTSESAWIASIDAGAVRYFSQRPVIDIMGLNTPQLYWDSPNFAKDHPVEAIVFMPAWVQITSEEQLEQLTERTAADYTVISNLAMQTQVVLGCFSGTAPEPLPVHITGRRDVTVYCVARKRQ